MNQLLPLALLLVLAQAVAVAAQRTPAAGTATTPVVDPAVIGLQLSPQDRSFVEQFIVTGLAEIELGEMAGQRSRHAGVRDLARRMASDRKAANQRLTALVAPMKLAPLPDEPTADHKTLALQLESAPVADFDRLYIDGQVRDHEDQISLLEMEVSSGDHPELKKFAADLLPVVREHLQLSKQLATELKEASTAPALRTPTTGAAPRNAP
jgi:putative membrane protein